MFNCRINCVRRWHLPNCLKVKFARIGANNGSWLSTLIKHTGLVFRGVAGTCVGGTPPSTVRVVALLSAFDPDDFGQGVFPTSREISTALQALIPLINAGVPAGSPQIEIDYRMASDPYNVVELTKLMGEAVHDVALAGKPVIGVISPSNSKADGALAFATEQFKLPLFSINPSGVFLNSKTTYPSFIRYLAFPLDLSRFTFMQCTYSLLNELKPRLLYSRLYPGLDTIVEAFSSVLTAFDTPSVQIIYEDEGRFGDIASESHVHALSLSLLSWSRLDLPMFRPQLAWTYLNPLQHAHENRVCFG